MTIQFSQRHIAGADSLDERFAKRDEKIIEAERNRIKSILKQKRIEERIQKKKS